MPCNNQIQRGDSNGQVTRLQIGLNKWLVKEGKNKIAQDGQYGPNTATAVRTYQQTAGFPVCSNGDVCDGITLSFLLAEV